MKQEGERVLLRVWLRSTDHNGWFSGPVVEELVRRAHSAGLAGATVFRGIHGLDVQGRLLGEGSPWALAERLPVVVEVIDSAEAIGAFLPTVAALVREGLVTLERAAVILYRRGTSAKNRPPTLPPAVAPLSTLPSPEEHPVMKESEEGQLLRVFIGEADTWENQPLYKAIVLKARELGLAGATVLRGPMGYGASSLLHTTRLLELSTDLPVVIEIVDSRPHIDTLLPHLDRMVTEGLITVESVRVLRYRAGAKPGRGGPA